MSPTHCYSEVGPARVRFEGETAFGSINGGPWLRLKTVRVGLFSSQYEWPVFPPSNPCRPTSNAKWHPPRPRA